MTLLSGEPVSRLVLNVSKASEEDPRLFVAPAGPADSMRQGTYPYDVPDTLPAGVTTPGTGQLSLFVRMEE